MPTAENQSSLGRSIFSIRRNQVNSEEHEVEEHEVFQKHISDRFLDLSTTNSCDHLLSIDWVRKLLDVFLCCEAEFKAILIHRLDPSQVSKPPLDRLIPELLERAVKALDICNGITYGIESIRHCQKFAEIVVLALQQKPLGEGQIQRAKKALNSLLAYMTIDDKSTERVWSFGRRGKDMNLSMNYRSLSLSVSRNWSAAKQIQSMSSNLAISRGNECSSGLSLPVYVMSCVLVFVMWALVTAIPCQERSTGLSTHFPIPRNLSWATTMIVLQERIAEEWKKKEKKGSSGLLEEIQRLEKCGQALIDHLSKSDFEEQTIEAQASELAEMCKRMEQGLVPLQLQIRQVFHHIVRSRAQILELMGQTGKSSAPIL